MDNKKLSEIPVHTIMSTPAITIFETNSVLNVMKILINKKIAGAPVINAGNKLVGVISERDILLQAASGDLHAQYKFVKNPEFLTRYITLKDAIITMVKNNRKWLPVVDDTMYIHGVISRRDLMKVILDNEGK